jgi:hypothetical protein
MHERKAARDKTGRHEANRFVAKFVAGQSPDATSVRPEEANQGQNQGHSQSDQDPAEDSANPHCVATRRYDAFHESTERVCQALAISTHGEYGDSSRNVLAVQMPWQ